MEFDTVRVEGVSSVGDKNDFQKSEDIIRETMRRNVDLFEKNQIAVTEQDSVHRVRRYWEGCINDESVRGKKGQHTKDIY